MDTELGPVVYYNPGEKDKAIELLDSGIEGSCSTYATTSANSREVFSMESIRAAYQKMKDMRPIPVVVDGKEIGEVAEVVVSDHRLLASMRPLKCDKPVRSSPPLNIPAFSIPIRVDTSIPMTWVPPESGSPHFSYGPEDEEWMRPLGLGKLVPTAVFINREIVDDLYRQFNIPEQFFSGDSNYSSAMMDRSFLWNY